MRYVVFPLLFMMFCGIAVAQTTMQKVRFATVLEGDTIPMYQLHEVSIVSSHQFLSEKEKQKNKKLIRNVKKMMPYAIIAHQRLDNLEKQLATMSRRERKAAINEAEDQLRAEFEEELKKCTFSQGKVLIKLIDRETGRTPYKLVGELKSSFRATFYQVFARLFGLNLKAQYDPRNNKDDELMERVILAIKYGQV